MSFLDGAKDSFSSLHTFAHDLKTTITEKVEGELHSHTHLGSKCHSLHFTNRDNRFHSFAPQRKENDAKWFVDGCGYMWAVSVAIEEAKESIWILDWWLSPGKIETMI
jgi:phospholipase D1/2